MDKLTEALAFYANPANWKSPSTGFSAQYDPEPSPVSKDGGEKAREALRPVENILGDAGKFMEQQLQADIRAAMMGGGTNYATTSAESLTPEIWGETMKRVNALSGMPKPDGRIIGGETLFEKLRELMPPKEDTRSAPFSTNSLFGFPVREWTEEERAMAPDKAVGAMVSGDSVTWLLDSTEDDE